MILCVLTSFFHTYKQTSMYLLLSPSGKGPNVEVVESGNKEKLYFGVEDPITASAGNFLSYLDFASYLYDSYSVQQLK